MKARVYVLVAILLTVSCASFMGLNKQEMWHTKPDFVACAEWFHVDLLEAVREDYPQRYMDMAKKFTDLEWCWVTQDSLVIEVVGERQGDFFPVSVHGYDPNGGSEATWWMPTVAIYEVSDEDPGSGS